MLSLLLILRRFSALMRHGWRDHEFRGLSMILAFWIAFGTVVFSVNEGWSIVQSLYFSVMTLTTIGYGDFTPSTDTMRLYTVVYSILGIGFFVAFTTRLVQVAIASRRPDDGPAESEGQGR